MAMPISSTASFKDRWAAKERTLGFEGLGTHFVACGESVLPSEAAPCLTFDDAESMPALWDVFGPTDAWLAEDKKRLANYRMIGSDGAGNPICVDSASGEIRLLDHEGHFRTTQFVNSGIAQLAECLLSYMGEKDASAFRAAIRKLDPQADQEGSFWVHEAAGIGQDT